MTVVLNIRNEWKQEDGQTQFTDTRMYFTSLISPSTEAKVTTSPTCFSI